MPYNSYLTISTKTVKWTVLIDTLSRQDLVVHVYKVCKKKSEVEFWIL